MKTLVLCAASALAFAGAVSAQTPTPAPTRSITADLNSAPPASQASASPAPAPTSAPASAPASTPASALPPTQTITGPTASRLAPATAPTARPAPAPRPSAPATEPAPAARTPAATTPSAAAPVETPAAAPAPPPPRPLAAARIAALPFTVSLPAGFAIFERPSNDRFDLFTVRRAEGPTFVSIYAGERSDYPIYGGREITAGGRTSIVVNEGDGDRAVEHIFLRAAAPREIHVWVGSVDDADRAVAEAIAQSIDAR